MSRLLLILYSVIFLSYQLSAQIRDSIIAKRITYLSDNPKQNALDSLIEISCKSYLQSPQNCGLSIGVSQNGQNRFYNFGEIKKGFQTLPTQRTIYEIGSLTKTFCGTLLSFAVNEHKLNLEDDIRKYLTESYPNLAVANKPIRIKHLANHTSGLALSLEDLKMQTPFDSLNPYKNYSKAQLLLYLKTVRLETEPGAAFQYSNLGTAVLSLILESIYNKTFEELVQEKICLPNDMQATGITLNTAQRNASADIYNENGQRLAPSDFGYFAATAGLHASTADMIRFLNYHLEEKDAVTQLCHQNTMSAKQNVGLFWLIKKTKQGNTLLWQNGGTMGSSSFCGFIKEKKCSVIVLSNSAMPVDFIAIKILNYLQQ